MSARVALAAWPAALLTGSSSSPKEPSSSSVAAVRGGLRHRHESASGLDVLPADLQRAGMEGLLQGVVGAAELGVPALIDAGHEQRVEQGALLAGEPDVGTGQGRQPLLGGIGVPRLRGQGGGEHLKRADSHRGEQVVAVGEMPVRGGHRDPEPAADLGQRELAHPALGDQADRGVDERGLEVAVVVPAALGGRLRWRIRHP